METIRAGQNLFEKQKRQLEKESKRKNTHQNQAKAGLTVKRMLFML
jgi:hypothetical protein